MYDDESTEWLEEEDWSSSAVGFGLVVALPLAATAISLVFGLLVGGLAGYVAGRADPDPAALAAIDPTDIRFGAVCAPVVQEAQTRIESLTVQLDTLDLEIHQRRAQVAELEAEMARRAQKGRQLASSLQQAREALAVALQERDALQLAKEQLVAELTRTTTRLARTEEELEEQKVLTSAAQERSLLHEWEGFLVSAQLEICERGSRRRMDGCRETVLSLLATSTVRQRFEHCVRSGQETPSVEPLAKGEEPPRFAAYLDEGDRDMRGWYLQLCDPTLPEADMLASAWVPGLF